MKVLKRSGKIENFELKKIQKCLECISDSFEGFLTSSDISNLVFEINKKITENYTEQITYKEIRAIIIQTLNDMGFPKVSKVYDDFQKSL